MYGKNAIDYHTSKTWNSKVLLLSRISSKVYISVSMLITGIVVAWVILGNFTRRVDVHGELVLLPHPIILNAAKSGYISEIFVNVGDKVSKNQPLFKIHLERNTNSGDVGINSKKLILEQIQHIDIIISKLQNNKNTTMNNINEQIIQNQKILSDIEGRLSEIKANINDLAKLISGYKILQQKGMATKNELVNQQLNYFQQNTLYQSFYSKQIQQQITITTLKSDFKTQSNQFESEILKYQIQKDELHVKLMETEEISEYIVNSPIDGWLETSNITIGQVVIPGSALAQINPGEQRDYKLIFWVPGEAIAWLKQQESINVRYDAFPYEKFGQFTEIIESISSIPATAQELSFYKNSQINPDPDNSLYKVIARVQHHTVIYDDKKLQMTDGMRASVTVFLEKRPIYQWMFVPLYSLQKNITPPDTK